MYPGISRADVPPWPFLNSEPLAVDFRLSKICLPNAGSKETKSTLIFQGGGGPSGEGGGGAEGKKGWEGENGGGEFFVKYE